MEQELIGNQYNKRLKEIIRQYFRSHQRSDFGCWCDTCQDTEKLFPNETMCDWL